MATKILEASLEVQFGGATSEKVFLLTTLELRRGKHVDMDCVLMDRGHIVHNDTDVGSSSSSLYTYLKVQFEFFVNCN